MRSIFVLLILVMIGLNGKGQSVTALPDSVLSQCCLEVTLLNGNVTTVDWVFIQYITRDGTGTKLFVEYAPNFGGIQWETQIRIQDDFDEVIERSKFIILPFTVGSTDYGIHRNWIANIEENTTTGGTWIYGRFGTPTKRKFSAVEDYPTLKALLLACRPRAIVVAENGLYTEGDTVRMGGILIENTRIETDGYNIQFVDTASTAEFGIDYNSPITGDTTPYMARSFGSLRNIMQIGRSYWRSTITDTITGLYSDIRHQWSGGNPGWDHLIFNPSDPNSGIMWAQFYRDGVSITVNNENTNPIYTPGLTITTQQSSIGVIETGGGYPGNGVSMGAIGYGSGNELLFIKTKNVDDGAAGVGQYLQLKSTTTGEVEFATIDLSGYLEIGDTVSLIATKYYAKTNPTSIASNYIATSNGTNLVARNLFDNNTYVGILNSKPFSLGQWTTAGRPGSVNGYAGFNTTNNWPEWYSSSGWFSPARAATTGGAFTAEYVPFGGTGGLMESPNFKFTTSSGITRIEVNSSAASNAGFRIRNLGNPGWSLAGYQANSGNTDFVFYNDATNVSSLFIDGNTDNLEIAKNILIGHNSTALARVHAKEATGGAVSMMVENTTGTFNSSSRFKTRNNAGHEGDFIKWGASGSTYKTITPSSTVIYNTSEAGNIILLNEFASGVINFAAGGSSTAQLTLASTGNLLLGTTTDVSRRLHVSGEARITDLTTDPPTQIVGADADGDLGALALSGLAISGGTLTAQNIGNTNLALTGNRTLHGAGFTLALNANTTVRDSFLIGNLPEFDSPFITISDNATGLQGKKKFLLRADSLYEYYDSYGFVAEPNTAGFQVAGNIYGYYHFADTLGFWESGMYKEVGADGLSTIYGDISTTNDHYLIQQVEEGTSRLLWKMTDNRITLQKEGSVEVFRLTDSGDMTVGDSLRVAALPNHTDPDSITTVKGGVIGKRKWMMPSADIYTGTKSGFIFDGGIMGLENSGSSKFSTLYTDTTGYYELTGYGNGGSDYSSMYGIVNGTSTYWRVNTAQGGISNGLRLDYSSGFAYNATTAGFTFQVDPNGTQRNYSYGTGAKEAADLSKTQSNYVAGFATDGTITDYRITRDTSTSNADFTVTSTLMSTCQELFISAEVTSGAADTVNVILPLPSSTYANKKVYVFGDDDSSTWWVATKTLLGNGLYFSDLSVKPTAQNYAAVTTTTGISGVTYCWICTRRNSGTWNWVLIQEN